MKYLFAAFILVGLLGCTPKSAVKTEETASKASSDKIQVLNFGTFHFGYTSDAKTTEYDENSEKAQQEIREVAKLIAAFKPTIICVEKLPKGDSLMNVDYQEFLKNPAVLDSKDAEISMLAFEVGRLSQVPVLYGIDHHLGYNYSVGDFIEESPDYENSIDPETYLQLTNDPFRGDTMMTRRFSEYAESSLLKKLKLINEPAFLDFMINANADKLLYVGIEDGFEGADNAALFYQRNMRIYSNLNRIKMTKDDRIFILMGGAHTAFLREFMERSPKFEMVNSLDYLK